MSPHALFVSLMLLLGHHQFLAQVDSVWLRGYPGTQLYGGDVTGDAAGNVYVTGQAFMNDGDYLTLKYGPVGNLFWARTYNGPTTGFALDQPNAIAVDPFGNVIVTGYSYASTATDADYLTIKYNSSGDSLWTRRHNGYPASPASVDVATSVTTDDSGNVYVTGYSPGPTSAVDVYTIKYSPNGDSMWGQYYNFAATNGGDRGLAITLDNANNVIVVGRSWGGTAIPPATGDDYLVLKYSSGGTLLGVRRQTASTGPNEDVAQAVDTDGSGNIYVTGYAQSGSWYIATLRFSSTLDSTWQANYTALGLQGKKIAVTGTGYLYVAGDTYDPNYLTIKYSTSGAFQWAMQYNNGGSDQVMDMGIDGSGNVYVTGWSAGAFDGDYATVKYDTAGGEEWLARYNSGTGGDVATGIHVFGNGEFAVCGYIPGQIVTIRYSENPVAVPEDKTSQLPTRFALHQNYPNPFNPTTKIQFSLPSQSPNSAEGRVGVGSHVTLKVYDLLGCEVATLVNEEMKPGSYEVTFDASGLSSGVYLYRLQAAGFVETKKLMLLR